MEKKRIKRNEIEKEEVKNKDSQESLIDSFKSMVNLFFDPAKSTEYTYETNQTIKNSYLFIYLSFLVVLTLSFLPSLNVFGIIIGALGFIFYVFFILVAIVAGSSFIWLSARIFDVKADFERQTNLILMFSTVAIILITIIGIINSIITEVDLLNALVFIYGIYVIYGIISIIKHTNNISWIKALIIVLWPILVLLVLLIPYIFLYLAKETIMPYGVSF
ncbi:MAG: YIP1 family protein [Candidatus Micrarchaeia archaeon]